MSLLLKHVFLLLLAFPLVDGIATGLSRSAGTPKHFYQARSLIVCQAKCEDKCNSTDSIWQRFGCNKCMQECIRKENMVFEDGPQAKIFFDFANSDIVEEATAVLEYRKLSDADDLHDPAWIISQIVRDRSVTITDLECGFNYQFRLTLITTKIVDRRTSSKTYKCS
ncbi:hypothetical protein Y032_0123g1132 [Ancylostoma ceylanicum]|uniref:Fibronectin type-III domain-containing protein n=1 Tax=Ancylostoma ceylanicum TaxID=53326 RepID=A0A016T9K6_9BILA|nr:hypothetical protein Y032_0123g1132 [Ancylostoma ceylanicum]